MQLPKHRVALIVGSVISVALLSGCTSAASTGDASSPVSKADSPTPTITQNPTPTPTPSPSGVALVGTGSLTAGGYTLSVNYSADVSSFATSAIDGSQEPPGKTAIKASPTFTLTLSNQTAGHDVQFSAVNFGSSPGSGLSGVFTLEGIFPAGSPVCGEVQKMMPMSDAGGGLGVSQDHEGGFGYGLQGTALQDGCDVIYAYAAYGGDSSWPRSAVLAAGQTATLTSFGVVEPRGGAYDAQYASNIQNLSGPFVLGDIDQAVGATIAADMAHPLALLVVYSGSLQSPSTLDGVSATCAIIASSAPQFHC